MSNLSSFLKANAVAVENIKYVASKRFVEPILNKNSEPTGKTRPVEWEIKPIETETDEQLRKECTKRVPVPGKRGQFTLDLDTDTYLGKLAVVCTVFPNLNSVELQDDYGVKDGVSLLKKMLNSGEYMEYKAKVAEANGFDVGMEELVDDAKN